MQSQMQATYWTEDVLRLETVPLSNEAFISQYQYNSFYYFQKYQPIAKKDNSPG
jgi:hypothetical protein